MVLENHWPMVFHTIYNIYVCVHLLLISISQNLGSCLLSPNGPKQIVKSIKWIYKVLFIKFKKD
jgi:hypothetical protein